MSKTRPKRVKKYDVEDLHLASGAILKGMGLLSESEYRDSSASDLLQRLEEFDEDEFVAALDRYVKSDIWLYETHRQLYRWYKKESKHSKDKYATTRKRKALEIALPLPPLPSNGCTFTDEELFNIIKQYPKRSNERGEMMRKLEKNDDRSKSTLYQRVSICERERLEELSNILKKYPKRSTQREIGLGYPLEYVQYNIRHTIKRKDHIRMLVIPVSFAESKHMETLDNSHLRYIDVCYLIGNSDVVSRTNPFEEGNCQDLHEFHQIYNENTGSILPVRGLRRLSPLKFDSDKDNRPEERITKLYFSPTKFPPPNHYIQHKNNCGHLRNYIKDCAAVDGSPVVCVGGDEHEKRFRCKAWSRRKGIPLSEKLETYRPISEMLEVPSTKRQYSLYSCTFNY